MNTKTVFKALVIIAAVVLITTLCDARTRTINTSSSRSSKNQPVEPTNEKEENSTVLRTISPTVSGGAGGGHGSSSANVVRNKGNVNITRTVGGSSDKGEKRIYTTTKDDAANNSKTRTINIGTSGRTETFTSTGESKTSIKTVETTGAINGERRTVSSDYKPHSGTRVYKTAKAPGIKDGASDTIVYNSGRRREIKTPVTKSTNRNYHGTSRKWGEPIGNISDDGNVYTSSDKGRRSSRKTISANKTAGNVSHVEVRESRHVIHDNDRWERPREYPYRYYYNWGGHWYKFPIARGHYPRYFYYWTSGIWCRVDRPVVYMSWERNDYYEDDHVFISNNIYVPAATYSEPAGYRYDSYAAKGETEENLIVKTLTLSNEEAERVGLLLDAEIIQNILASVAPDEENRNENSYEYDAEEGLLMITAPEEIVLKIQTLVQDERTFKEFYDGNEKLAADVISVVSPVFLEKDYSEASRLGGQNCGAIQEFLESLDSRYLSTGKKCWYNESIGTITVVDEEENLYRAWEYMNKFPYIPKGFVE